jgi:hypothetical protein
MSWTKPPFVNAVITVYVTTLLPLPSSIQGSIYLHHGGRMTRYKQVVSPQCNLGMLIQDPQWLP